MNSRFQSYYQWDDYLQSEANDIAFTGDGEVVAVAASRGGVVLLDTRHGDVLQILQFMINVHPLCLLWVEESRHHGRQVFIGCSDGIVASFELGGNKKAGKIDWVTEQAPEGVRKLAKFVLPDGELLLGIAYAERVDVWKRTKDEWNRLYSTPLSDPAEAVENLAFFSDEEVFISYSIRGLILWNVTDGSMKIIDTEDHDAKEHPDETEQSDLNAEKTMVIKAGRDGFAIYDISMLSEETSARLISSHPLVSHGEIRFGSFDSKLVVIMPETPSRLKACFVADKVLDVEEVPDDRYLDHEERVVGNVATYSKDGTSAVFTTSLDPETSWVRMELWKTSKSSQITQSKALNENIPLVMFSSALQKAISDRPWHLRVRLFVREKWRRGPWKAITLSVVVKIFVGILVLAGISWLVEREYEAEYDGFSTEVTVLDSRAIIKIGFRLCVHAVVDTFIYCIQTVTGGFFGLVAAAADGIGWLVRLAVMATKYFIYVIWFLYHRTQEGLAGLACATFPEISDHCRNYE